MKRKSKKRGDFMLQHRRPKRPHCMPTHVTDAEALHVTAEAYERGWSNSAYIRHLIVMDMLQKESERDLRAEVSGITTEQLDLTERGERRKQKTPQA